MEGNNIMVRCLCFSFFRRQSFSGKQPKSCGRKDLKQREKLLETNDDRTKYKIKEYDRDRSDSYQNYAQGIEIEQ